MNPVGGSPFSGFRILQNDPRILGFELLLPNEKMNAVREIFKGQRVMIEYYDGKIKVYLAPHRFDSIIRALSVF